MQYWGHQPAWVNPLLIIRCTYHSAVNAATLCFATYHYTIAGRVPAVPAAPRLSPGPKLKFLTITNFGAGAKHH